jgi:hypothetical protein
MNINLQKTQLCGEINVMKTYECCENWLFVVRPRCQQIHRTLVLLQKQIIVAQIWAYFICREKA